MLSKKWLGLKCMILGVCGLIMMGGSGVSQVCGEKGGCVIGPEEEPDFTVLPDLPETYVTVNFNIHYTKTGVHAPPLQDSNNNGHPDYIEDIASNLENSYSVERGFGFQRNNIFPLNVNVYDIDNGFWKESRKLIELDNNDQVDTNIDIGYRKVVPAHELFHALQYKYINGFTRGERFAKEGTARWSEDAVYDDVVITGTPGLHREDMQYFFNNPNATLTGEGEVYKSISYWKYISEAYGEWDGTNPHKTGKDSTGSDVILSFWEEYGNKYNQGKSSIDAINEVMKKLQKDKDRGNPSPRGPMCGDDFKSSFADWTAANYLKKLNLVNPTGTQVNPEYRGLGYHENLKSDGSKQYEDTRIKRQINLTSSVTETGSVQKWATEYYKVDIPSNTYGAKVKIIPGSGVNKGDMLYQLVGIKDGNKVKVRHVEKEAGGDTWTASVHEVDELGIIVSGGGTENWKSYTLEIEPISTAPPTYSLDRLKSTGKKNPEWKIDIDKYGHSDNLRYNYTGVSDPSQWIDDMYEWAAWISYKYNDGSGEKTVKSWLYDFPSGDWTSNNNPNHYLESLISNNQLDVTIKSWIDPWYLQRQTRQLEQKYVLRQSYTFKNKTGYNLEDFRFIQYMDLDIGKTANEKSQDQGYAPAYGLHIGDPPLPGRAIWILDKPEAIRGYGLTCLGYPQPDQWYYDHRSTYTGNIPKNYEGIEVGQPWTIMGRVDSDYLWADYDWNDENMRDVAGALRWSRECVWDSNAGKHKLQNIVLSPGEKLTIDEGLYVVPEPCTLLLMGSGLAGLAGFARRRRKNIV